MASTQAIALMLLVAAVQSASATFPYGPYGGYGYGPYGAGAAIPAAGAQINAVRASGHAAAAESKAGEAAVDRALGMPIAAAINEGQAIHHSAASANAAANANVDAALAGGAGGSGLAAAGATLSAARAVGTVGATAPAAIGAAGAALGAATGSPLMAAGMLGAAAANGAAAAAAPAAAYGAYGLYGPYGSYGAYGPYGPAGPIGAAAAAGATAGAASRLAGAAYGAPYYGVGLTYNQQQAAALATGAGAAAPLSTAMAAAAAAGAAGTELAGLESGLGLGLSARAGASAGAHIGAAAGATIGGAVAGEAGAAAGAAAGAHLGAAAGATHGLGVGLGVGGSDMHLGVRGSWPTPIVPGLPVLQNNVYDRPELVGPMREIAQEQLETGAGLAPGAARRALDAQVVAPLESEGALAGARTLLGLAGGVAGIAGPGQLDAALAIGGPQAINELASKNNAIEAQMASAKAAAQAAAQAVNAQRAGLAYRDARLAGARDTVNVEGALANTASISDGAWATHDTAQRAESALTGADVATDTLGTTLDADGAFLPPVTASLVRAAPYGSRLTVRDIVPRPYALWHGGMMGSGAYGLETGLASATAAAGMAPDPLSPFVGRTPFIGDPLVRGPYGAWAGPYGPLSVMSPFASPLGPFTPPYASNAGYWPSFAQAIRYARLAVGGAAGAGINALYANQASDGVVPALGPELPISGALDLGELYLPPHALMPVGATLVLEPRDSFFKDYLDADNTRLQDHAINQYGDQRVL